MSAQPYAGLLERLRLESHMAAEAMECRSDETASHEAAEAISSLLNALAPFAAAYVNCLDENDRASDHIWESGAAFEITVGDLRNAEAVVAALNSDASTQTVGGEK